MQISGAGRCLWLAMLSGMAALAQAAGTGHIQRVTALTEVFPDSQKVTTAVVEYDAAIAQANLKLSSYAVAGRVITAVYANTTATKTAHGVDGRFVILELSPDDASAPSFVRPGSSLEVSPPVSAAASPVSSEQQTGALPAMANARRKVDLAVTQSGAIRTASGKLYAGDPRAVHSSGIVNLVVDEFRKLEFQDPENGRMLRYNLFVPRHYDPKKSYPLVLFMPDRGVIGTETDYALVQGQGAIVWATPEEQAKHESFVLAPQFDEVVVTGTYKPTGLMDSTVHLVEALTRQYSIDRKRIYTTGQSLGCILSIGMNIKYPELFAASLLVSGQWLADETAPMARKKLWIVISESDQRAYPGMNAIVAVLEKNGAKVSRARWDARASRAEQAANVKQMIDQDSNVKFVVFAKDSTLAPGQVNTGNKEHMGAWKAAYQIEGLRDWLFAQSK